VLFPQGSAHLEDVGEVRGEIQRQRQKHILDAMVDHADPLEHPAVPDEAAALDMQDPGRRRPSAHRRKGAVGRVAGEIDIVLADARTQPRRPREPCGQHQPREDPGVIDEQAVGPALEVAPSVGHQKGVAVLQRHQPFKAVGLTGFGSGGLDRIGVVHEVSRQGA